MINSDSELIDFILGAREDRSFLQDAVRTQRYMVTIVDDEAVESIWERDLELPLPAPGQFCCRIIIKSCRFLICLLVLDDEIIRVTMGRKTDR